MSRTAFDPIAPSKSHPCDSEVVELPVLLPRWQIQALESAAQRQGITMGQMIRRFISQQLASASHAAS